MYITSVALRHVLMNYVALLWVEVSQPWFTRFREGCEDFIDDSRSGQLSITLNPTTIVEVHKPVARHC
jgi:hypothetical protein